MSNQETIFWPATFEERNLAGDVRIQPEDIRDYSIPPGNRKRYTPSGWRKAMEIGVAELTVPDIKEVLARLQRIEAAARELLVASANDGDDFIKSSYEIAREALRAALEK